MSAAFGHATIQRGNFERRHVRCGRTCRRLERAHREVFEGRDVHQSVGKERHGSRRLQCCLSWEDLSHTHACSPFRSAGFDTPHAVAIDSKGRLFVADRNNNRIQIFDQDRKFLEEWKAIWPAQRYFHRRQGHNLRCRFSVGFEDEPGFKQGIRIGNAKDGLVKFSFRPLDLRQSPRRLRRAWRRMPRVICTEPKPSA